VLFVATTGSDANGGTTWADACLTITNAVAKAKDAITNGGAPNAVIYVGTGTFTSRAEVLLDQPIVLIGGTQNPGQASVIAGQGSTGNYRVFRLTHAGAVLDSLTISNGYSGSTSTPNGGTGGNIRMSAGLVTNCVIRNATIRDGSRFGGGLFMSGGLVVGCTISANNNWDTSRDTAAYGGGVYMTGGELRNSRVNANYFSIGSSAPATITCYGAGVYVANSSAVVESCLIDGNYAPNNGTANSAGGGVYVTSGTVRNCTIVNNQVLKTGLVNPVGGVRQAGGTVLNSIIWSNTISGTVTAGNYYDGGTAKAVTNSCAPELNGIDGNISAYPQFIAPGSGNFRLAAGGSPCVDAGLDEAWMGSATDKDGNARLQGSHVDMGAYETAGSSSIPGAITDGVLTGGTNISFTVNGSGPLVVQVSTNLANPGGWVDLLTNTAPFSFTDTNAVNTHPLRFYRTKVP
jgi:hypothetical protein